MTDEVRWLDADEQTWWRAYLRANREIDAALDRDLACHGVSLSEYELLSMLSEAEGRRLRMSALAELIVQSRSRVTHTAARLERRGWVRRTPAPDDGRGVVLELTPDGLAAVERLALAHVASVRRHVVDVLAPSQFRALGEAMATVRAAYAADPTTPPTPCDPR
ncbi:MAG: MarR family transcriptional regulator [Micrococcales bacterium]|uniref:MarR family winged helix-turn-helix transcriptional regulator n=1 Tax=Phycicoccus sp. TaxID=1902410 RepID=UPI001985D0FD|nr:MarR family transcriptional regulator [Phycicoccus sp.]MBD3783529.1 MarR family transcriptional regulator [Micrococcales bacterium]HMM95553.1 MarR family transcriptional regulator [Phycicoccus sp.]